jgi:branched-chain amino acid transport system substrate-binding protein
MKVNIKTLAFSGVIFLLSACTESEPSADRIKSISENDMTLKLALAWPLGDSSNEGTKASIKQGVDLAVSKINKEGGVLGRRLEVAMYDDQRSINVGLNVSADIIDEADVFAVIGHLDSYISVPAAANYDRAGIINLNPGAADPRLTGFGATGVFSLIPNSESQGRRLAKYLDNRGISSVAVYYIDNAYGKVLANGLEVHADALGLNIADKRSYQKRSKDHDRIFQYWSDFLSFEAVILIASMPEGKEIVSSIRDAGINAPIFAAPGVDTITFARDVDPTEEQDLYVMSYFHPDYPSEGTRDFVNSFEAYTGMPPSEASAALGYDSVNILVRAVEHTGSLERADVAAALKEVIDWRGAAGRYSFNSDGEPLDKLLLINVVRNQGYEFHQVIE